MLSTPGVPQPTWMRHWVFCRTLRVPPGCLTSSRLFCLQDLYNRCTDVDLSETSVKSDLFRQRSFLEKGKDHLETYKTELLRKRPLHLKTTEENAFVLGAYCQEMNQRNANRTQYEKYACEMESIKRILETKKKSSIGKRWKYYDPVDRSFDNPFQWSKGLGKQRQETESSIGSDKTDKNNKNLPTTCIGNR